MNHYFLYLSRCYLVIVLFSFFVPAHAARFEQGDMGVSVVVGSGQAFNENYTIAGAGIGYYVLDGLKIGVDVEVWMGGSVDISKVSPQIQYVFARENNLKPYVGAFFRKMKIDGFEDLDSAGARAGVFLSERNGYYMSIGVVHENYLSCDKAVYVSCSDTYPELTFTFSL